MHQAELDVHEERLRVGVRDVPYRRLRVAKRVVVEQQTITVDVRREELVVEELDVDEFGLDDAARGSGSAGVGAEPLVLVLSQEVPDEVLMRTEPVEVVRVHVDRRHTEQAIRATLAREQVDVDQTSRSGSG